MIKMASVEAALKLLREHGGQRMPAIETVPLQAASGRTLAEPVLATVNQPPADVSAMDGYAVRFSEAAEGANLQIIGESRAGAPFNGEISPGQCVRIFTGAHVPGGADHILIQEEAVRQGDRVTVAAKQTSPSSIRQAGLDFAQGDTLVPAGTVISAGAIALAAAGNVASLKVRSRPRVGVLATGDELVEPGASLKPGMIVNSIQPALLDLVSRWGGDAVNLGVARDTVASVSEQMDDSLDLIVSIGGASVGDYDVVRDAFAAAEFTPLIEKIAVKPGKPTWFSATEHSLALGLPGNPAAALVTAQLFLRPLLGEMLGQSDPSRPTWTVRCAADLRPGGRREEYLRARLSSSPDGLEVRPWDNQDSSLLHPFISADALIRRSIDAPAVTAGQPVEVIPLA